MTEHTHKPHHHGDLPRALIEAGIDILESEGFEGLSLRKCAARAGVSHAAPAHHFGGLPGLREAIAIEGFQIFTRFMQETPAQDGDDPAARLRAICLGYFDFVAAHPALFQLMFFSGALDKFTAQSAGDTGTGNQSPAYATLRAACAPFTETEHDALILETQVWSLIHGYSTLYLAGAFARPLQELPGRGPIDEVLGALDALIAAALGKHAAGA